MTLTFAETLRAARKAAALPQSAVARACDVSCAAVSRWECGGNIPSASNLLTFACLTGADARDLSYRYLMARAAREVRNEL